MTLRLKQPPTAETPTPDADAILQVKVWLLDVSRMVWRRRLVPGRYTLRKLHGAIQVAGLEGIHLYDFQLRAARYGSWELSASSPDVTLAALRFRKGARFVYEYDLNNSLAPRSPHRGPARARKREDLSLVHRRQWCLSTRGLRRPGALHGRP